MHGRPGSGVNPNFLNCLGANFNFAFGNSFDFFYGGFGGLDDAIGSGLKLGIGAITAGEAASAVGGLTFIETGLGLTVFRGGLGALGVGAGTVAIAGAKGIAANVVVGNAAFISGLAVGSAADALGQTIAGNCPPEPNSGCE